MERSYQPGSRLAIPVGNLSAATADLPVTIPDENVIGFIHKCLPVIFETCGECENLQTHFVYVLKNRWIIFPFSVLPSCVPLLLCSLMEMFPGNMELTNPEGTRGIRAIRRRLRMLEISSKEQMDHVKATIEMTKMQIAAGEKGDLPAKEIRALQTKKLGLEDKLEELQIRLRIESDQISAELDEKEEEQFVGIQFGRFFEPMNEIAVRATRGCSVRKFGLTLAHSVYVACAIGHEDLSRIEDLDKVRIPACLPSLERNWWYWCMVSMQTTLCKPSRPLGDMFDYRHPKILTREGFLDALEVGQYTRGSEGIESKSRGSFQSKENRLTDQFISVVVKYLNTCLFLICEGAVAHGILKYSADGVPIFDIKSAHSVEEEFRPLHFDILFGKRSKYAKIYAFDLWKDSAEKNSVKRLIWVPWGGWPCSLINEMNGLDYGSLNRYLGYRYTYAELAEAYSKVDMSLLWNIKKLIFNNLCGCDAKQYLYVVRFLAKALQFPFVKQGSFLMFTGAGGIGKGTIILAVGHLMNTCFYHNKSGEIDKVFNSDFLNRSFIFFDEMHVKKESYSWLKTAITEPTQRIEEKYKTAQDLPSFWSCVGASNDTTLADSYIDCNDRRFYFADCIKTKSPAHAQLAESVGRAMAMDNYLLNKAFGYWLMNVDVSNFDATKIPETRSAVLTQQRNEGNCVYLFLAECLETETLLPSPGNEFLRQHNYLNENPRMSISALTTGDAGVNMDNRDELLVGSSITVLQDDSGVWNPLSLNGERLEKWKKWYRVDNQSSLIDAYTWNFMKQRQQELFPDARSLNRWMKEGGWLHVVPCAQLYNRFVNWCKVNGFSSQKWSSTAFVAKFQDALGPGAVNMHTIGTNVMRFFEIQPLDRCKAFFNERLPAFKCASHTWSSQLEILDPPPVKLSVFNRSYIADFEERGKSCPMTTDFITELRKQLATAATTRNTAESRREFFRSLSFDSGLNLPAPPTVPVAPSVQIAAKMVAEAEQRVEGTWKRKFDEIENLSKNQAKLLAIVTEELARQKFNNKQQKKEIARLSGTIVDTVDGGDSDPGETLTMMDTDNSQSLRTQCGSLEGSDSGTDSGSDSSLSNS
jgi:hypothetical protein